MPRNEARIFTSIWKDKAFLALPPSAQRLYMFLLSQPDLAYCGLISLRPRRWARTAAGMSVKEIEADLEVLSNPVPISAEALREGFAEGFPEAFAKPFLVVDEETEEVLIRSFIRRDEVWKQPNLMKAAREAAEPIESPAILAALLDELRRIPAGGSTSEHVRKAHAEFVEDLRKGLGDQDEDRGEGSGKGSPKGSTNPSQEKGGGNGSSTGDSSLRSPNSGAPSSARERATPPPAATLLGNQLLDEHVAACASRPPRRVQVQLGERIDELLAEDFAEDLIREALTLLRGRPKAGPGLLPSLAHEVATERKQPANAGRPRDRPGAHQPFTNPPDPKAYDDEDL